MSSNQEQGKRPMAARHSLLNLGWTSELETILENMPNHSLTPARVVGVRKNSFQVSQGEDEWLASLAGRLAHCAGGLYPVTGDWVLLKDSVIHEVLPRRNTLSRGASGVRGKLATVAAEEQVIAANLDTVFVVCGLDRDFNLRRIERLMTLVFNCGLNPAVILTKADLHPDPFVFSREVEDVAFGTPVHLVSAEDEACLESLGKYLARGKTITMLGSSGAGKSTLVNRLAGLRLQATGAVSQSVGKGKHTTTSRDLIMMPQGGMVIDNPGIREIALWGGDGGVESVFPEIERLAGECRFSDCSHSHEPGCRVLQGIEEGLIDPDRLESYHKMKREMSFLAQREHKSAERVEKERWKGIALKVKSLKKTGKYR